MTASTARLDLRLNAHDKERIARAAALRGVPISTFVRTTALREADNIAATEEAVVLSREEGRRLLKALERPFSPNAALKKALDRGNELGL